MHEALIESTALAAAGPLAEHMNRLGWQMTWLGVGVFALVLVLGVIGLFRRSSGDGDRAVRRWIVGGGVILSSILVVAVFLLTLSAMRATSLAPTADGITVDVTGHQWWWQMEYPGEGVVTANELHLPVDVPVQLRLTSADVIHSFWVPEIGGKIDLLPDGVNTYVIQADEPGTYQGVCAEFCGLQHARMRFVAVAMPPDQFRMWAERQGQPAPPPSGAAAERGLDVFERECGECHTVQGTAARGQKGPDLTHLASRRTLGAGTLENTSENLRNWIEDPHRYKEGVEMPAVELDQAELDDLVAYLEGLE